MVTRRIRLADHRGRHAVVVLMPVSMRDGKRFQDMEGNRVRSVRRIKGMGETHPEAIYKRWPDSDDLARALIDSDPEVDLETAARATGSCDRVYSNPDGEIIYTPTIMEIKYDSDGMEVERRPKPVRPANTSPRNPPVWSGVLIPVTEAVRRYAFTRAYQVMHTNALEYDFLFGIASYLHERESMALVGSGGRGRGPLVLERNGPRYRGFLHGRIMGDSMCLMLYLSQFELKMPEEAPCG